MKKVAMLVGLGVFPLVLYPSFFLISVLPDIVAGDKSVIFLLTYEPPTAFLRRALTDWWSSLPFSYALVFLVILPMHILFDRFGLTGVIPRLLSMALVSGLVAVFLIRLDGWSAGVVVVGGVVLSMLFHFSVYTWRRLWAGVEP